MDWDQDAISSRFADEADRAEAYLREITPKVPHSATYQQLYDEHLAEFAVAHYFAERTFLRSREEFVEELHRLRKGTARPLSNAKDRERFQEFYYKRLDTLIEVYSDGDKA